MNSSSGGNVMRSNWYQLLALGFSHPDVMLHRLLRSGEYQALLARHGGMPELPEVAQQFSAFEAGYIHLFQLGNRGAPLVSLNAADHEGLGGAGNRPEFLLGYSSWYRHFGLKVTEGTRASELPDHIGCQLEFMCWLAHLDEVNVGSGSYFEAQGDFIERHLLPFLELLLVALNTSEQKGVAPFYGALTAIALEAAQVQLDVCQSSVREPGTADNGPADINVVNLWE